MKQEPFASLPLETLMRPEGFDCACGKHHAVTPLKKVLLGEGVIRQLPEALRAAEITRPLLVADPNTMQAAGLSAQDALTRAGVPFGVCLLDTPHPEPDERSVGAVTLALDGRKYDGLLAVGSGVINDICKVVCRAARLPQATVATAPSMDGYLSDSASMLWGGLKTSVYCSCPVSLVCDTAILSQAPARMLQAGVGDMLCKCVSLGEWHLSEIINEEYYCPEANALMLRAAKLACAAAEGVKRRDPAALRQLMEGIILSGVAVTFVHVSRPSSGLEHYLSHVWDMRAVEAHGAPDNLHGIQTGVGTLITLKLYEHIRGLKPDFEKAKAAVRAFDREKWERETRRVFGSAADAVIAAEAREGKHDWTRYQARIERIERNWDEIQRVIADEIPPYEYALSIMQAAGGPTSAEEIGESRESVEDALVASQEIRDKYVLSRLLWDLGLLEEAKGWL